MRLENLNWMDVEKYLQHEDQTSCTSFLPPASKIFCNNKSSNDILIGIS